jgi:hypothetical protein
MILRIEVSSPPGVFIRRMMSRASLERAASSSCAM